MPTERKSWAFFAAGVLGVLANVLAVRRQPTVDPGLPARASKLELAFATL
jgi:hypothetical protein